MAIAGYKLKINGGAYIDRIIDVGNVLEYEIDELQYGVEYAVQVAAYDDGGMLSFYSDPVYGTPLALAMLIDIDGNALIDGDGNALVTFT
jgi:hypothetical protein